MLSTKTKILLQHIEKVRLIESVCPLPLEEMIRGQYGPGMVKGKEVLGYRQENGVAAHSSVETFASGTLFIDTPRWKNVPFHIKAGKRLSKKSTEIILTFKSAVGTPKQLIFRVQPEEEIAFIFNSPQPKNTDQAKPHQDAYARLLYEAMCGDNSHFVSYEEHLASWRLFSPILKYWEEHPALNFPNYSAGSEGPLKQLTMRDSFF